MSEETKTPVTAEDIMLNAFRGEEDVFKEAEEPEETIEVEEEISEEVEEDLDDEEEEETEVVAEVEEVIEDEEVEVQDNEDWDVSDTEEDLPVEGFAEVASDLGFENISSKEDLVKAIKDKEKSISEASAGIDLEKLPKDLQDAISVVQNGGDYKKFMNTTAIDYSKIDPKSFFIEAAKEHFVNEDGSLDSESLDDFIEDQDDTMMTIQGNAIKKQYVEKQVSEQNLIKSNALRRKQITEIQLNDVLDKFDSYNEFKVKETHKKKLYQDITSGKAMKEMFYNKNGEYDMSKVVKAYFYYMKGDQMEKFRAQRAKNTAVRDVLKDANNADLKVNGRRVTDNSQVVKKEPFDYMAERYGMNKKG